MSKIRKNVEVARNNAKLTDRFPSIKQAPAKIVIKTEKDLPVTKTGKLRQCSECAHSNEPCTWCDYYKKSIFPFQYGCFNFITDEEELRRKAESAARQAAEISMKWQETQKAEEEKCNWLLTLMLDMVVGSQLILADFERRTDMMFKNNPFPDAEDVANHKSDKNWIFKHKYAFASIKKIYDGMKTKFEDGCSKIRTTYESTIQKHIVGMCTNPETKKLDEKKYTSIDINAAEFTRLLMLVMNKCVYHDGNFEKIVDFVAQLDGEDVFSPQDISRFKIK